VKKLPLFFALFVSVSVSVYCQTFSCPSGTEGMLNYFVMGYPSRVDHYMGPGNGIVRTRYLKYHYGCNSSYANGSDMEVFTLGYQVGLYDWKHYVNQNGNFVLVQDAVINGIRKQPSDFGIRKQPSDFHWTVVA
jgi:hypothetical protein